MARRSSSEGSDSSLGISLGVPGVWPRLRWSVWPVVCPWRSSNFKLETSLFVAALVKCTLSGSRKPSLKDPSCRWNAGLLSTKSTCRSLHSTWRPALRASMRSVTSWDFRLGHTLETVTDRAMVFALSMRSLYSPTMSVMGLSTPLSQSLPPTARITRQSLWSLGNLSTDA